MRTDITFMYDKKEKDYVVRGYPELKGRHGADVGDGMALFFGEGWKNYEFYIANTLTGQIRKLATKNGDVLVGDDEIDFESIKKECENGFGNAKYKDLCYAGLNRWDGFKNGLCAITWTLYPDGRYFADEDGFGMEDNEEEVVYGIINTNLEFIEPFRPVKNIGEHLKELRSKRNMKTSIFNLIILDESGSMSCIRKQTILGCNEVINTIKVAQTEHADTQNHFVSIYAFQSGGTPSRYLIKNESPEKVCHITETDYTPCGCTPLYDAVGITVNSLREIVRTHEHAIGSVTIITDGMENSSKEYSHKQVSDMIEQLKKDGWNFSFIGANIDVEKVSRSMNIDNAMAFEQTNEGTCAMFERERYCRRSWFSRVNDCLKGMDSDTTDEEFAQRLGNTSKDYFNKD